FGAAGPRTPATPTGSGNAVSRTAGLLAIAVLGIVVLGVFSGALASNLGVLHLPFEVQSSIIAQQNKLVGIEIPAGLSNSTHAAVQSAISESFIAGFRVAMIIAAVLALASALSSLLLIEGKKPTTDAQASQVSSKTRQG